MGNRLTETNYLGTATYAYDPADRLTSVTPPGGSPVAYAYDANGNEVSAGGAAYAYNLANELVSASVGNTTQTYAYSGDGVRLSAATGSQASKTVRYTVDRAFALPTVVAETDGSGGLIRRYAYGLALLSQTTSNKGPYWYHEDALGSVTDVTGGSGTPLWWGEYQPYGQLRESGATSQAPLNPFLFTGQYQDGATGLYYLRARQYDPSTGRLLSVDPAALNIYDPYQSTYSYAAGDPVRFVDPAGRDCVPATASAPTDVLGCLVAGAGAAAEAGLAAAGTAVAYVGALAIVLGTALQGDTPPPAQAAPMPSPVPVPGLSPEQLRSYWRLLGYLNPDAHGFRQGGGGDTPGWCKAHPALCSVLLGVPVATLTAGYVLSGGEPGDRSPGGEPEYQPLGQSQCPGSRGR